MTNDRSPLDAALDVVLFAPLGLALTIGEELPKLAAKGRAQVSTRVGTARVVGQFTVIQGRRRVEQRARREPTPVASPSDAVAGPVGAAVAPSKVASRGPRSTPTSADAVVPGHTFAAPGAATTSASPAPPAAPPDGGSAVVIDMPGAGPVSGSNGLVGAPPVHSLAIPGYDSLSASQVVQRLAGLSSTELEAVKTYEAANRGRRTVLARVGQLQG